MRKTISFFDDFLKISAVSTLLLFIAGFVELKSYYSKFGISINEYISTSEVLLSSFDRLALVIFSLLVQMILWVYLFNYLFNYDLEESLNDGEGRPKKYHNETVHRFVKSKVVRLFWIFLIIGTFVTLIFNSFFPQNNFWTFTSDFFLINYWIGMCIFLAWLQPTKKIWEAIKTNTEYNGKVIITVLVFFTVFIVTLWVKNTLLFNRIRKYGNEKAIQITISDKTIISQNDSLKFIGKTENYFFYWNKNKRQAIAYPASEVISISYK